MAALHYTNGQSCVANMTVCITHGFNGVLQAFEDMSAKGLEQVTPYPAEPMQCHDTTVSKRSFCQQMEGVNQNTAGHTAQLYASEQGVRNHSIGSIDCMPAATLSMSGNTVEPLEASAGTAISRAAALVVASEAAAAAETSEVAAAVETSEATAMTMTSETTAATTAATATMAATTTVVAATAAPVAEAMALPITHSIAEFAGGMDLLQAGQSTTSAMHMPSYAHSSELKASAGSAVCAMPAVSNTWPAKLLTQSPDAEATDAAGAAAAVDTQPVCAMMPKESCVVQPVARVADSANTFTQPSSCCRETDATSVVLAAVPAELAGMAVTAVNSVSQADNVKAEGTDPVLRPSVVMAEEVERASEAGIKAEEVDGVAEAGSAEAEGTDSVAGAGSAEAKEIDKSLEASSVEAEEIDSVAEAGSAEAEEVDRVHKAGSAAAEGTDRVHKAGSAEAEGIGRVAEAGSATAEGIKSVAEACSAEVEEINKSLEAGRVTSEGIDRVPEAGCDKAEGNASVPQAGSTEAEGIDSVSEAGSDNPEGTIRVLKAGSTEVEDIDSVSPAGSAEAWGSHSASASDDANALTANGFADSAELVVKPDSRATDVSDMQTFPATRGATEEPAITAAAGTE